MKKIEMQEIKGLGFTEEMCEIYSNTDPLTIFGDVERDYFEIKEFEFKGNFKQMKGLILSLNKKGEI